MRTHYVTHPSDRPFADEVAQRASAHGLERADDLASADVAFVLASAAALRDGLGGAPAAALAAGVPVLLAVRGDVAFPDGFPVARKHLPLAVDAAGAVRLLEDHARNAASKIADGKRELFAHGVLLALLARGG